MMRMMIMMIMMMMMMMMMMIMMISIGCPVVAIIGSAPESVEIWCNVYLFVCFFVDRANNDEHSMRFDGGV